MGSRRTRRVRVLFISDVRVYADAVARCCNRHSSVRIVPVHGDHDAVLAHARGRRPDVALLDMRMPESRDLARALVEQEPVIKLVGLGLPETEDCVLAYAEAGFAGYVPRDTPLDGLIAVLRGVARGELRYSRRITATLLRRLAAGAEPSGVGSRGVRLTRRETEIVRLLEEGLSNREIARRLSIKLATVKNHVHHVLEKLHVHRRGEAVARLRRQFFRALNPRI